MTAILAFLFLLIALPAFGATKYINNASGCPGTGSTGSPYCTIQSALNTAVAGDIFRIRGTSNQVYNEQVLISAKPGTLANPIILEPDTGASFIWRTTANGGGVAAFWLVDSDYWTIRNIRFDATGVNPGLYGVVIQAVSGNRTGIVISGNTFKNWTQTDGQTFGPNALIFAGCSTDLGCAAQRTLTGIIENNLFEGNHNKAVEARATLNTIFRYNRVTAARCGRSGDSSANTLGFHFVYGQLNLQVYENVFDNFVSKAGCPLTNPGHATTAAIWCDVDGFSTSITGNKRVYKNIIHDIGQGDGSVSMPNGGLSHGYYGVFIEAGCQDWHVYNNVIYRMGLSGITNRSPPTQTFVNQYYHNTLYDIAGYAFSVITGKANFTNNVVKLVGGAVFCQGCFAGSVAETTITSNYNLYDDGASQTKIASKGGTVYNLANWRTQCSCDANSTTGDPLFTSVSVGSENLSLTSTSPAINTGVSLGFAYNGSAPDRGAFETILFSIGEVGLVNSTTAVLTFTNNVNPPLLPASSCTGFTVQEFIAAVWTSKTLSSCTRSADGQITLVFTVGVTGGNSLRISYSGGNVTDSALIGNANNQPLFTITNQSITNNVSGSPSHVFDFTHFQFYELRKVDGSLVKLPQPAAAVNTDISLAKGASLVLDIQVNCENVADCPASAALARYNRNGSGFSTIIPDTVGSDGISMLGQTATGSDVPANGETVTGCLVAGGRTEFDGQTVVVANAVPTFNLTQNSCIRLRFVFDFAATAEPGDTFDILPYNQDGTQLTASPTKTPRITIREPRSGTGF